MASFVTVPIEARTSVYEYLLTGVILSPRPVARRTRNATKAVPGTCPTPLNLFLVNKQVFLETNGVLLRFVTIRLKSRDQLQVLARQPLIAHLIVTQALGAETLMLTNRAAKTSLGALAHLKSLTFELDGACLITQSLEDASVRPLKPPNPKFPFVTGIEPSLIYYHSSCPSQFFPNRESPTMNRIMRMVSLGLEVILLLNRVSFYWRNDAGELVRSW